jgi:hypothetical protein
MIGKLDFVGVPSRDAERAWTFYVETLGLRPDDKARFEVWVGDTCFAIWEPERLGRARRVITRSPDASARGSPPGSKRASRLIPAEAAV